MTLHMWHTTYSASLHWANVCIYVASCIAAHGNLRSCVCCSLWACYHLCHRLRQDRHFTPNASTLFMHGCVLSKSLGSSMHDAARQRPAKQKHSLLMAGAELNRIPDPAGGFANVAAKSCAERFE